MNISLNIVKNIFQIYVKNNKILNDFYYGDMNRITDENNSYGYPLLAAIPTGNTITKGDNGEFNSISYNFNMICADIVNGDEDNVDDILSDTAQNLSDFVSFLDQNSYCNEYSITINGTALNMNTFFEKFSDVIAGHTMTIGIVVPWKYIDCNIPMVEFTYKDLDC